MFNKAIILVLFLFFNLQLMSNVFSLNKVLVKNNVDTNKFSSFSFASMKFFLIFRIE